MITSTVGIMGSLLALMGSIMTALSVGKNLEDAHQTDSKGNKIYLASIIRPALLPWGIGFLIFGFVLLFAQNILLFNSNGNIGRYEYKQIFDEQGTTYTVFDTSNGNIYIRNIPSGKPPANIVYRINNKGFFVRTEERTP